jgi:hypothetical protein
MRNLQKRNRRPRSLPPNHQLRNSQRSVIGAIRCSEIQLDVMTHFNTRKHLFDCIYIIPEQKKKARDSEDEDESDESISDNDDDSDFAH